MRRGEVWIANLNPSRGLVVGKIRPVVIMQQDELTAAGLDTVTILPLTSRLYASMQHLRITVSKRDRLLIDSQVMVDKIRALDRRRILEGPITRLTDEEMATVEFSLRALLGMG